MDKHENMWALFKGDCGHQWVGAETGSFGCPICGTSGGSDHHLVSMDPIEMQYDDWGTLNLRRFGRP